nr:hypothetical protein [Tanacetum cinerariifolium]
MANLSFVDLVYDEAGPSYDTNTFSKYVHDNEEQVVQSDVSSVPNDTIMMVTNDIYEQDAPCVTYNQPNNTVYASLTAELARYKELAKVYEKRAQFELTERELMIDTQMRMIIKDQHFDGIQTTLIKEIKEMKEVFNQMEAEVDQHAVDKKCDEIEWKNLLLENENLIAACLTKDVFYTATYYVLTVSRFSDMHDAYTAAQKLTSLDAHAFELVFEIENLKEQLQGKGNTTRELKVKISRLQKKHSEADPILNFKALDSQNKDLNAKVNVLQDLNERLRVENEKVKQHYKELYDSIKLTRAKTIKKTTSLLTEIETLKAQIKGKTKCVTMYDPVKPKVFAPESVGTLREIVEEAMVEKPLDCSLASACLYTKHSQELLEYVIGTCPKDFNKRDRKNATTPLIRKKQVTFVEPCETSTHNTQTHVEQQKMKKTNEPGIPSI